MTIIDVREPDVPAALGARPSALDDRALFGHPRGLGLLFFTEMWERFSYYGMRAILVLYLVNALKWDTPHAANLYGTYMMLVYLTPVIGGFLADRLIGTRRSLVIGSIADLARPLHAGLPRDDGVLRRPRSHHRRHRLLQVERLDDGRADLPRGRQTARRRLHDLLRRHQHRRLPRAALLRMVRAEPALRLALGLRLRRRRHAARARHLPVGPRQVLARRRHLTDANQSDARRSGAGGSEGEHGPPHRDRRRPRRRARLVPRRRQRARRPDGGRGWPRAHHQLARLARRGTQARDRALHRGVFRGLLLGGLRTDRQLDEFVRRQEHEPQGRLLQHSVELVPVGESVRHRHLRTVVRVDVDRARQTPPRAVDGAQDGTRPRTAGDADSSSWSSAANAPTPACS